MVYIHLYMGCVCIPVNYYLSNLCKWKIFSDTNYSVQHTRDNNSAIKYSILFTQSCGGKLSLLLPHPQECSLLEIILCPSPEGQDLRLSTAVCDQKDMSILKLLDSIQKLNLSSIIIKWKYTILLSKQLNIQE